MIKEIFNKKVRTALDEQETQALAGLNFCSIMDLGFNDKYLEILRRVAFEGYLRHKDPRYAIRNVTLSESDLAILIGFGNGVVYVQQYNSSYDAITTVSYLDFITNKAVELKAFNPQAQFSFQKNLGHISKDKRDDFYMYLTKGIVNLPGDFSLTYRDQLYFQGLDASYEDLVKWFYILGPIHELGHTLELNLTGMAWYLRWLKVFSEVITAARGHSQGRLEALSDFKRGNVGERYASKVALNFIKTCEQKGVEILRGIDKRKFIHFVNQCLHTYEFND
ncbi:MAG TPA: hypothetical protein VD999_06205 [Vitreimonas sp.]|nr:hypothetical protein [Vitreimonas sp.]